MVRSGRMEQDLVGIRPCVVRHGPEPHPAWETCSTTTLAYVILCGKGKVATKFSSHPNDAWRTQVPAHGTGR